MTTDIPPLVAIDLEGGKVVRFGWDTWPDSAYTLGKKNDPDHAYQVAAIYLPTIGDATKEHQALYSYDAQHRLTGITQQLCTVSTGHACSSTTATGSDTYAYDDADSRTRVVTAAALPRATQGSRVRM